MEAWAEGLWAASWPKSLEGLTAEQAAWQPPAAPGAGVGPRHSIWQIVEHMIFWRETWLRRIDGGPRQVPKDELAAKNFPQPREVTEAAWGATRRRFEESHELVARALQERGPEADPMLYFLPHDSYHFGQVNYLRAMLGLKAIE
jgi:uncharacterized damage-inducible protein DinB